jgi:O-acetylhomoserine (thiol)-lyase
MSKNKMLGFATNAIHAGATPDPVTGSVVTPIYQSAAYVFPSGKEAADRFALKKFGQIYGRVTNPTQDVLEQRVTALEGGTASLAVASGLAAQFIAFQTLLEPGDEFVSAKQLYGGTVTQFTHTYKRFGWSVKWGDINDLSTFEKLITPKTKAIYADTIANPDGRVVDLAGLSKIAKAAGLPLIIDNTVATPYLCRPFEHGADIVIHSLTKFLGGHGNSMGGIIVDGGSFDWTKSGRYPCLTAPRPEYNGLKFHEAFGNIAFAVACRGLGLQPLGPCISPFNAFQIITGIETLPLRMEKHCSNALKVAEFLQKHAQVKWVSYAGLPGDKHHNLAKHYMPKGAGSVYTFGVKGGYEMGVKVVANVKLFSHLANIGDTRSLIIHPASTTHSQLSDEHKIAAGASPDTIRVSIGLEDVEDITADLDQALMKAA